MVKPTKRKQEIKTQVQNQVGRKLLNSTSTCPNLQKIYDLTRKTWAKIIVMKKKRPYKTTKMSITSYKSSVKWKPANGCYWFHNIF